MSFYFSVDGIHPSRPGNSLLHDMLANSIVHRLLGRHREGQKAANLREAQYLAKKRREAAERLAAHRRQKEAKEAETARKKPVRVPRTPPPPPPRKPVREPVKRSAPPPKK